MKKRNLLACLFALLLVSCGPSKGENNNPNDNKNPGGDQTEPDVPDVPDIPDVPDVPDVPDAPSFEHYYDSILNLKGEALVKGIHDLVYTGDFLTYNDIRDLRVYEKTDVTSDGQHLLDFYTHKPLPFDHGSNWENWNREHVWPQSLFGKQEPMRSDLNHVRPSDSKLNNWRGNLPFAELDNDTAEQYPSKYGTFGLGCVRTSKAFEPLDLSKGDTARIVVYMASVHSLNIRQVMYGNDATIKQTLLSWNELDPVDNFERTRNIETYKYQQNMNPFIDHNELFEEVVNTLL